MLYEVITGYSPESFLDKYTNLVKQQEVKVQKLQDKIKLLKGDSVLQGEVKKVETIDGLEKKLKVEEGNLDKMKNFDLV